MRFWHGSQKWTVWARSPLILLHFWGHLVLKRIFLFGITLVFSLLTCGPSIAAISLSLFQGPAIWLHVCTPFIMAENGPMQIDTHSRKHEVNQLNKYPHTQARYIYIYIHMHITHTHTTYCHSTRTQFPFERSRPFPPCPACGLHLASWDPQEGRIVGLSAKHGGNHQRIPQLSIKSPRYLISHFHSWSSFPYSIQTFQI